MRASALAVWKALDRPNWARFGGRLWLYWQARWTARRGSRLRLAESLGLGERRSVAILEVEGRRFLLGATQQAVTLLAELRPCARVLETPGTATIGEITVPDGEKATRHGAGRDPDDRETDGHDTDDREHAA